MSDLLLTADGDLDISAGNLHVVSGRDAIDQDLRVRLRTFLGEWFVDTRLGVDWFGKVLRKPYEPVVSRAELRRKIMATPGVISIDTLDIEITAGTRAASVTAAVRTVDGEVNLSVSQPL